MEGHTLKYEQQELCPEDALRMAYNRFKVKAFQAHYKIMSGPDKSPWDAFCQAIEATADTARFPLRESSKVKRGFADWMRARIHDARPAGEKVLFRFVLLHYGEQLREC